MKLHLKIVTSENIVINKEVDEVTFCGIEGYFTILANHAPFVTRIVVSSGYYVIDGKFYPFSVKGGFVRVRDNECDAITSKYVEENFKVAKECYDNTVVLRNMDYDLVEKHFDNAN